MIRRCRAEDFDDILGIVNDAATAYRGVIPADRWHDPYMSPEYLRGEIDAGVVFWGFEEHGRLAGIMGLQEVLDVTLVRHAYVLTARRRHGIGGALLSKLLRKRGRPVLVGTWAAASWAIDFYRKFGFRQVSPAEKDRLLRRYWKIPERQVETSVVLALKAPPRP